jgi:hypothetical protein
MHLKKLALNILFVFALAAHPAATGHEHVPDEAPTRSSAPNGETVNKPTPGITASLEVKSYIPPGPTTPPET